MNAMGNDYIREVNVVKSARVGYSKMLLGVYAYFIQHKQRNSLIWLPTDGDAENFMKSHVEPTIRDIPHCCRLRPGMAKAPGQHAQYEAFLEWAWFLVPRW
jgi:phage terminase large subunit GpA-like protein